MRAAVALAGAVGSCALSCAKLDSPPAQAGAARVEIYQRASNQFAQADFYKPAESKTHEAAFALAPLVLQEVTGVTDQPPLAASFGTLSRSNGLWVLDRSWPAIYWRADTVTLNGKAHTRLAYWWFYPTGAARSESAPHLALLDRGAGSLTTQGVRVTLNSAGLPAIWEVLADSSGFRLVFVAQSLEAAAAARFGKPLPGRRYAVEQSLAQAPKVMVARVIDDGPVAMGPILYLNAASRTVSTLICRCMPAQAKVLRATIAYDLLPLPDISGDLPSVPTGTWSGEAATDNRLEHWLRLPDF